MLEDVIGWLVDIGMATGPILGYVSQYNLIKSSKSIGSFSIDICGILLFANILRLNFYIFKQYQTALLFQSIFMISMQMLLLYQCCKYQGKGEAGEGGRDGGVEEGQSVLGGDRNGCKDRVEMFWRWVGFEKYKVTVLFFGFCSFATSLIFKLTPIASYYGELVGLFALTSQSILILPQILRNITKKSTKGLSHMLVTLNLSGDIFKLIYFVVNKQPFQFILCGVVQVVLDSFVVLQIFYYDGVGGGRGGEIGVEVQGGDDGEGKRDKEAIESQVNLNHPIPSMQSQRDNKMQDKNDESPAKQDQMYEQLTQQIDPNDNNPNHHSPHRNQNHQNEQIHQQNLSRISKKDHSIRSPTKTSKYGQISMERSRQRYTPENLNKRKEEEELEEDQLEISH